MGVGVVVAFTFDGGGAAPFPGLLQPVKTIITQIKAIVLKNKSEFFTFSSKISLPLLYTASYKLVNNIEQC
jgi:hypothetical protein